MKSNPLVPISLIVAVDVLGLTLIIPLLPFIAQKYGASPLLVGVLFATYSICQLVSGPILGQISDRYGRRPVLLFSQVGTFLGFLLLARAEALVLIFLSRVIDGSTAGNLSVAQAYIADVTPPEKRAKSFAIIGIAFGFGFLVGPALSGLLSTYGFVYPIYFAAGLSLLSVLLTFFILPEPTVHVASSEFRKGKILDLKSYRADFQNPKLRPALIQFITFFLAFSLFIGGIALFSERRFMWDGKPFGPREVGYVFAYTGLIGMIVQGGLLGRLVQRFGEERLVKWCFLLSLVGYSVLAFAKNLELLLVSATLSSLGGAGLRPCLTAILSKRSPANEQGRMMGVIQSMNSMTSIVGPVISGFLIGHEALAAWALLMALFSGAGFYFATLSRREEPKYESKPA